MNLPTPRPRPAGRAFTLIELLVVMAIIGLIAGFLLAGVARIGTNGKIKRTQAELSRLEAAIDSYHAFKGLYPPDNGRNPRNPAVVPLFYELTGTMYLPHGPADPGAGAPPDRYEALQGTETIDEFAISDYFGRTGFLNASTDRAEVRNFLPVTRTSEVKPIPGTTVLLLVAPVEGPGYAAAPGLNPWCYLAPGTNNQTTYDLWADLKIGSKHYRVCNWQREAILLPP